MGEIRTPELNIYYGEFRSSILGQIYLAATDNGVFSIRFDQDSAAFIARLAHLIHEPATPSIMHNPDKIAPYRLALQNYFDHKTPIPLDLNVDLSEMTDFQQDILNHIRNLPLGATTTYGEIADQISNPNASRAIGQVLRRNPIPIIIPCHRVLSADGTLGGYGGVMGSERKIALLKHEDIILA